MQPAASTGTEES
jgi:hypothetical protein